MSRIMQPAETTGPAPSHAPPDTRYAPGIAVARALGWFSIGLGLAELLVPERVADVTGVHDTRLLQFYGLREIVCGIGILQSERPTGWMWARVAGDALDLRTLASVSLGDDETDAQAARRAFAAVAGVAALDAISAAQLTAAAALEG